MSADRDQRNRKPSGASANKPMMLGYTVRPIGDGKKSVWSKVAAAWAHKDGEGYEVRMDALPVDGRLVLRTIREDEDGFSGETVDHTPG